MTSPLLKTVLQPALSSHPMEIRLCNNSGVCRAFVKVRLMIFPLKSNPFSDCAHSMYLKLSPGSGSCSLFLIEWGVAPECADLSVWNDGRDEHDDERVWIVKDA